MSPRNTSTRLFIAQKPSFYGISLSSASFSECTRVLLACLFSDSHCRYTSIAYCTVGLDLSTVTVAYRRGDVCIRFCGRGSASTVARRKASYFRGIPRHFYSSHRLLVHIVLDVRQRLLQPFLQMHKTLFVVNAGEGLTVISRATCRGFSGHFPMKTYLARFHCLEESTSLCCRFGCEQEETREHLLSCPQLTSLRKKTIGSENFPQTLSLNYLLQLDNFLAVSKIT